MKLKKLALLVAVFAGILVSSCSREDDGAYSYKRTKRTVLIYMAAENNLDEISYNNLNGVMSGARNIAAGDMNLVVYLDPESNRTKPEAKSQPRLLHITVLPDGTPRQDVVKWYDEQNSLDPSVMQGIFNDLFTLFPSDEYGLMLWSHASGWLPALTPASYTGNSLNEEGEGPKRSFGDDGGSNTIKIDDLAEILPDNKFKFIIFDACYMGAVEVAYQLRSKIQYLVSSPTEVLAAGYPYDKITPLLFANEVNLEEVAETFFEHYASGVEAYEAATVSVVKTSELQALAEIVKEIIDENPDAVSGVNKAAIQKMGRGSFGSYLYDMGHYMEKIATPAQYLGFAAQMDKLLTYKANTPNFVNLSIDKYSGLSMYILGSGSSSNNDYYKTLDWYKAVYQ